MEQQYCQCDKISARWVKKTNNEGQLNYIYLIKRHKISLHLKTALCCNSHRYWISLRKKKKLLHQKSEKSIIISYKHRD